MLQNQTKPVPVSVPYCTRISLSYIEDEILSWSSETVWSAKHDLSHNSTSQHARVDGEISGGPTHT